MLEKVDAARLYQLDPLPPVAESQVLPDGTAGSIQQPIILDDFAETLDAGRTQEEKEAIKSFLDPYVQYSLVNKQPVYLSYQGFRYKVTAYVDQEGEDPDLQETTGTVKWGQREGFPGHDGRGNKGAENFSMTFADLFGFRSRTVTHASLMSR